MDLGVTVRLPWASLCLACPLAGDCGARTAGLQYTIPVMPARPAPIAVEACALMTRSGRVLLVRRGSGRLWAGFWEFPRVHVGGADPAGRSTWPRASGC
jgi:A/G-specific adenine glycosylase